MNTQDSLIVIIVAALVHASFQLSVSVLTLLSSHTIGAKKSHVRLLKLSNAFVFGAAIMTMLLISTIAFLVSVLELSSHVFLWIAACGLLFGLGAAVWIFYYRKEQGTTLWLPRSLARYLSDRTKATKQSAEAFGLGLSSVVAELLFIFVPIFICALVLAELPAFWQVVGIVLYTALSLSSLLLVNALIGSGHRISRIQKWREENKLFLQFVAGSGLLVLGFFVYVERVLTPTVLAAAGAF